MECCLLTKKELLLARPCQRDSHLNNLRDDSLLIICPARLALAAAVFSIRVWAVGRFFFCKHVSQKKKKKNNSVMVKRCTLTSAQLRNSYFYTGTIPAGGGGGGGKLSMEVFACISKSAMLGRQQNRLNWATRLLTLSIVGAPCMLW